MAKWLGQNQIRFSFVGKEVSDVSAFGEQDLGGFLHAAVSDVEMDDFRRMADGYASLVKVLADDHIVI